MICREAGVFFTTMKWSEMFIAWLDASTNVLRGTGESLTWKYKNYKFPFHFVDRYEINIQDFEEIYMGIFIISGDRLHKIW